MKNGNHDLCQLATAEQRLREANEALQAEIRERKRAEDALRESEARYRRFIDNLPESYFFYRHGADGVFTFLSPTVTTVLGYSIEDFLAHYSTYLTDSPVNQEVERHTNLSIQGVRQPPYRVEIYRKNGSVCHLEVQEVPVLDEQGRVVSVEGIARDITAQHKAEEVLAEKERASLLAADIATSWTEGRTLPAILNQCAEAIVLHLGAAFARIWTLNRKENVLELRASAGMYTHLDGPHGRVPVGELEIGLIAKEAKPHLTNDVLGDPRVGDQEWARREGMVSFAGYPLMTEGRVSGVMAMFARRPLGESTLNVLGSMAERIAIGMERRQAEEALAKSEVKYRSLFESSRDALMTLFPPEWRFTSANSATVELFGAQDERAITALGPWDVSPERQPDGEISSVKARRMIATAMERGSHFFEWTHKKVAGPSFPTSVLLTRVELDGQTGLQATVRDITERKRAEEALLKAFEEIKTLRGILPICSGCKKIRDDRGSWSQLEVYVRDHTDAEFSHSLCPDCIRELYPEHADDIVGNGGNAGPEE